MWTDPIFKFGFENLNGLFNSSLDLRYDLSWCFVNESRNFSVYIIPDGLILSDVFFKLLDSIVENKFERII